MLDPKEVRHRPKEQRGNSNRYNEASPIGFQDESLKGLTTNSSRGCVLYRLKPCYQQKYHHPSALLVIETIHCGCLLS